MNPDWERCGETQRVICTERHHKFSGADFEGNPYTAEIEVYLLDGEPDEAFLWVWAGAWRDYKTQILYRHYTYEATAMSTLREWAANNGVTFHNDRTNEEVA